MLKPPTPFPLLVRLRASHRVALVMQFIRFGIVGAIGLAVDTAIIYATRAALGLYIAGAVGLLVAASSNWLLNRAWTFRGRGDADALWRQWLKFLAANSLGASLNRGTYFLLVTISPLCATNPVIATFSGTMVGMFVNFTLSRRLVFR